MSIDKRMPVFGNVNAWGISRHGLVKEARMTLGNGAQIDWQQPSNNGPNVWSAANTFLVRRPGWTGPALPPDQAASLFAEGHEFRNYAILSGGTCDLGGRSLGINSWLWFDAGGACWRYQLTGMAGTNAARSFTFSRRRFGLLDVSVAPSTVTTAPIDLGQSGAPTIYQLPPGGGFLREAISAEVAMETRLVSTTPDGARSLWMCYIRPRVDGRLGAPWTKPSDLTLLDDRPLAFVEVSVNPDGTLSAETIRGRTACLGAHASTSDMGPDRRVDFRLALLSSVPGGCGGSDTRRRQTYGFRRVYDPPGGYDYTEWGNGTEAQALTGAIIAMWYDTVGGLHEITLDISRTFSRAMTPHADESATAELVPVCDNTYSHFAPSITGSAGYDWTLSETLAVVLRDNGAEIPGVGIDLSVSGEGACTIEAMAPERDVPPSGSPGFEYGESASGTVTVTLNGDTISHTPFPGWFLNPSSMPLPELADQYFLFPWYFNQPQQAFTPITFGGVWVDVVRWSNHAIGARLDFLGLSPRHRFGNIATPSGPVAHAESVALPHLARLVCSGSWHPVTHQFASSVSQYGESIMHYPVCWA